jgi:hypothetical protein
MEDDLNFKAILLSLFNNNNLKNKWFWHHTQTKETQIKSFEENFEKERKKTEQEELEKFEAMRDNWHVTKMLFNSFKADITYNDVYDSNEDTSEDEIVEESEKLECDLCSFKGKTPDVGRCKVCILPPKITACGDLGFGPCVGVI